MPCSLSRNMREQKSRIDIYKTSGQNVKDKNIEILQQNSELPHDAKQEDFYSVVGRLEQESLIKESILRGGK